MSDAKEIKVVASSVSSSSSSSSASSSTAIVPNRRWLAPEEVAKILKPGSLGTSYKLACNHFQVKMRPDKVHRYLVEFDPDIPPDQVALRRKTLSFTCGKELREIFGMYSFDGITFITIKKNKEFLTCSSKDGKQKISIRYLKSIVTHDTASEEVQMCCNVMLNGLLRKMKLVQFGRAFYYPKMIDIGCDQNLKMYNGFQASILPSQTMMTLTIDLKHRIMHKENMGVVLERLEAYYWETLSLKDVPEDEQAVRVGAAVNAELQGATVFYNNERIYRVDLVDYTKTIDSTFTDSKGADISFATYFKEHHKIELKRKAPGMIMNTSKRGTIFLPPELCCRTGLTEKEIENRRLMTELADHTRKSPSKRAHEIKTLIKNVLGDEKVKKAMNESPIQIVNNLLSVTARILGPFQIKTRAGPVKVSDGRNFSNFIRDSGFLTDPEKIGDRQWAIMYDQREEKDARLFTSKFLECANSQGGSIGQPLVIGLADSKKWEEGVNKVADQKPRFVVVLVPRADPRIYSMVHQILLVQRGIICQGVQAGSFFKGQKSNIMPVAGNTFKQVMAKLNYFSWGIKLADSLKTNAAALRQPTMFVGVDVCHDRRVKNAYKPRGYKQQSSFASSTPTTTSTTSTSSSSSASSVSSTSTSSSSSSSSSSSGTHRSPSRTRKGPASTVGFCASYDPDFLKYNSFVALQNFGEEYVSASYELMRHAVRAFKNSPINKAHLDPVNIIVYRDGVGNSQITSFVRCEIEEYKRAFKAECKKTPNLTVILVQKQ
eukprot:TRINITY_DN78_c1_g1_i1.p1 TRINITY_DN78_c1_g1~~TRINITY_DN78_c1_g1_i1.p1  ORF type:complete len:773 (+),score=259.28 TRINITY_DN78_c1_g1_i1:48-2366(+)